MATSRSDAQIGFIGLGRMGAPMASQVVAAGYGLSVLDLDAQVTHDVAQRLGARACSDAREIAEVCSVVITMLPNGRAVQSALLEDSGGGSFVESANPETLVIDMSSSAPSDTRELARAVGQRGLPILDAPVSGGVARAIDGTLSIMVGGEDDLFQSAVELLRTMGTSVRHVGPIGAGHAAKALNNAVSAAGLVAACEALLVGRRFGIAPEDLLAVLNASSGRNNATENKVSQFILSRHFDSGFALGLLAKDLGIATALADEMNVDHDLMNTVNRIVREADAVLPADADHTAVAAFLESEAGLWLTDLPT